MAQGSHVWVACVLPWFGLTDGALGAKEWKLGFVYTVRARYGPVLTSSDDSGVVVMVSRPLAVPNEPWIANCECVCFTLVWPHQRGIGGQGVKAWRCMHEACALWTSVDL